MKHWIINDDPTGDFLLDMEVARKLLDAKLYLIIPESKHHCFFIEQEGSKIKYPNVYGSMGGVSIKKIKNKMIHGDRDIKRYLKNHILFALPNYFSYWIPNETN